MIQHGPSIGVAAAAKSLASTKSAVRKAIVRGRLAAVRTPTGYVIDVAEVERYRLESRKPRRVPPPPPPPSSPAGLSLDGLSAAVQHVIVEYGVRGGPRDVLLDNGYNRNLRDILLDVERSAHRSGADGHTFCALCAEEATRD